MRTDHIRDFIDERGLSAIDGAERERLEVHAAGCPECSEALIAARFSAEMLRSRAEVSVVTPPPFFEARVMAAVRERQAQKLPFWSFGRWWQASSGMVGAMVLMAAVFAILTIFAPSDPRQADMSNYNIYSTEADILSQRSARDVTREQMLEVIYSERKEQGKR